MTSCKLFVGQIARTMDEATLANLFSPYGTIVDHTIIRDRATNQPKGCAFVTFSQRYEADAAIAALHNKRVIPPLTNPMQVQYSDAERTKVAEQAQAKLFVGMLPKDVLEEQLRPHFAVFGPIEEITVLRDPNGISRGCGFVKYLSLDSAQQAIAALHERLRLEGSIQAAVVKFADTDKQKMLKRPAGAMGNNPFAAMMGGAAGFMDPTALAWHQFAAQAGGDLSGAAAFMDPTALAWHQFAAQQQLASGQASNPYAQLGLGGAGGLQAAQFALAQQQLGMGGMAGMAGMGAVAAPGSIPLPKQTEGPAGANLFIYHLPQEYTDAALIQAFSPFGNVISAKVFIDKNTGLSKCFGFVSYDNAPSASAAIASMNGFQLSGRRLKVSLKRNAAGF